MRLCVCVCVRACICACNEVFISDTLERREGESVCCVAVHQFL